MDAPVDSRDIMPDAADAQTKIVKLDIRKKRGEKPAASASPNRCRANSRRGLTDPTRRSYPPVESVRRALEILRTVNRLRIASVSDLHAATGLPKPTVVRMLETLISDGYVARDNMCGGYRVTCRARELNSGYEGISRVIEASRPWAIDLTQRLKWPIGIGVPDGDAIALQFWTGTISPWAHTNTVLGNRPNLVTTAMGRTYMAFCSDDEREHLMGTLRANKELDFGPEQEAQFRKLLVRVREDGYAMRDPQTEPRRTTTVAMPIRNNGAVLALITISFYSTAIAKEHIVERVIEPLRATTAKIEETLSFMYAADGPSHDAQRHEVFEHAPMAIPLRGSL
jgi:IclR family mhp operon transcriptional activator